MARFTFHYTQTATMSVTVDADDEDAAREEAIAEMNSALAVLNPGNFGLTYGGWEESEIEQNGVTIWTN